MSRLNTTSPRLFLVLCLILSTSLLPAEAVSFVQLRTLISLSKSLMNRVSNLRASRGDYPGSQRAKKIADQLKGGGLGLYKGMWSMGIDYLKNYAWGDVGSSTDMFRAISEIKEILMGLNELTRLNSDQERAAWVVRNYQKLFSISKSILWKLLQVFRRSGPLREVVLILQEEIEGGLLKDCLELGANDLKGLVQIVKDLALQYSTASSSSSRADL
ncbi:hypothetical protein C5167_008909 [Papaver somniferum]|uniref:Uncharacterized protein n=1 Tax=Papaver somniferum TaxID=3469 RepID=A0A4Y7JXB4_PAPSO|nr:uncharacterized protein LOC113287478 [Papaver somniferum]RZC65216.1 hypothetical protein C5167_008909 [Papaver somniferum]